MVLGLDERIQTFSEHYLPKLKETDFPELDTDGKNSLMSILYDAGYQDMWENKFRARLKSDGTVDVFVEQNLTDLNPGFSYIKLDDINSIMNFKNDYERRMKARKEKEQSRGYTYIGLVSGFCSGGFADLVIGTLMINSGSPGMSIFYNVMASVLISTTIIGGAIGNKIERKKLANYHHEEEMFKKGYKITVGKSAILQALSIEPQKAV